MNQIDAHFRMDRLLTWRTVTIGCVLSIAMLVALPASVSAQSNTGGLQPLEPLEPLEDGDSEPGEAPKAEPAEPDRSEAQPADTNENDTGKTDTGKTDQPTSEDSKPKAGGGLILNLEDADEDEDNKPPAAPADSGVIRNQPAEEPATTETGSTDEQKTTGEAQIRSESENKAEVKPEPPKTSETPEASRAPEPPNKAPAARKKADVKIADVKIVEVTDGSDDSLWVIVAGAGAGVAVLAIMLFFVLRSPGKRRETAPAAVAAPQPPGPSSNRTAAILRDLSGTTEHAEHQLLADTVQIGRAEAASDDIQSVVVRMNTVGRRHAVIEYRQHAYWIVDQGSLNGTYLNGERLTREKLLHHGSRIQLESAEFEFVIAGAQNPGATMAADPDEFIETMVANADDAEKARAAGEAAAAARKAAEANVPPASPAEVVDFDVFSGEENVNKPQQ